MVWEGPELSRSKLFWVGFVMELLCSPVICLDGDGMTVDNDN